MGRVGYVYSSVKPSSRHTTGLARHEPRVNKPIQGISGDSTNIETAMLRFGIACAGVRLPCSHTAHSDGSVYAVRWRVVYDGPQSRGASAVGIAYVKVRDWTDVHQTDR